MTDETTLPPVGEPKWKRYARAAGAWAKAFVMAHPDWLIAFLLGVAATVIVLRVI